ncbi:CvpA family protein [Salinicoccus albus]|uniref:CvpA family protein n=1 Tax=Salinicoccus albus TaxID=418756 RepID=UPI000368D480|nr:CvpA family protein [Salinicoccus albus]
MILTLIILLILAGGFFIGLRRGLVYEFVHLTGFLVSLAVAYLYFTELAPHLRWIPSPDLTGSGPGFFSNITEDFYYRTIAFLILFLGVNILWNTLGSMLNSLAELPVLRIVNRWFGGAFGFVKVYLIVFLLLNLVVLIPIASAEDAVSNSALAQGMVEHTPFLSEKIEEL